MGFFRRVVVKLWFVENLDVLWEKGGAGKGGWPQLGWNTLNLIVN
jgi:hypothetical protein